MSLSSDRNASNGGRARTFSRQHCRPHPRLRRANDGTSDLILQGIRRVKFSDFEQEAPFPIARIKPLKTRVNPTVETDALANKYSEFYTRLKSSERTLPEKIDHYLGEMSDPEMVADLIASTFVTDVTRRQQLLEELDLNQRLRLLIQYLREENGSGV